MRLPNRFKRTFHVANETRFSSDEFEEPYKIRGLFIPKGESVIMGGGVTIQGNSDTILFESNLKGVREITQNSKFWINRKPIDIHFGGDNTHFVTGRQATSNRLFIVISLETQGQNMPIL